MLHKLQLEQCPFCSGTNSVSSPLSCALLSTLTASTGSPVLTPVPKAGQGGHQAELAVLAPAETAGPVLFRCLQ